MPSNHSHVLVVEDSRVQAKIISQHIEERTPFQTIVTHTLADTKQVMAERRDAIFVAILDRNLPDDPDASIVPLATSLGIPSVVMTASFSEEVRQQLLAQNVVDYFIKSMAEITTMERLIERLYKNLSVRVLVADDSKLVRKHLVSLLRNLNLQAVEAEDGRQALDILTADPHFALLITDYNMPRLDGFGLIEAVRVHHPKDALSIIGVSAENGGHIARFLKIGANDFLVKPIQMEEFTCRVHQQLDMLELVQQYKALCQQTGQ